jgi:PAS domain S-box-containing protein
MIKFTATSNCGGPGFCRLDISVNLDLFRLSAFESRVSAFTAMVLLAALGAAGQTTTNELRTVSAVRRLTAQDAERHIPVRLQGVVTFANDALFSRFVQDDTAGIYLDTSTNVPPPMTNGQLVEVEGVTGAGEFAPIVVPTRVKILGVALFPAARAATIEELMGGQKDSQFIEVKGIVRSVRFERETSHFAIDIVTGGERFTAYAPSLGGIEPEALVDSTVRVRGVCSTLFNRQRQFFGFRLLVPRPGDLTVEKPAPVSPFGIVAQPLGSLLQYTLEGSYGHRVKVVGTVAYYETGSALFVENDNCGLYAQTGETTPLQPGDEVEILGFPAKGEYTPMLQDAVYRKIGQRAVPQPDRIDLDEALKGTHDCQLVQLQASLLDRTKRGREQFLVLQTGGFVFHAVLAQTAGDEAFSSLENGSEVLVTGVCVIERGSSWRAGETWRAKSFRLLLRSAEDVKVLKAPPWWTLGRLLWMVGILGVGVLAAFAWVGVLRRRVQKQTEIIQQKLQTEAALKERYEALFENANDTVFTLDLAGRITTINDSGERLLQRSRKELLSKHVLDLVPEDQRAAARQWLEQVVQGAELPTAEWDVVNAAGQRAKLEINTRIVARDGKPVEVEAIARDITERRQLERELLEISNREQRRIGHDLHDGVCQQLAGIAYRLSILGDRLHTKAAAESAEVEQISSQINEANSQARSVARGLFPVRLEDSGLVAALEELAESIASRFKVDCESSSQSPPLTVDSEVTLHVYFIAQEAVFNAVKHGAATKITISLSPQGDHYTLAVRDNGKGFQTSNVSRAGMGIRIMRHRARVIGATLELTSQPGQGTKVSCVFSPVSAERLRSAKDEGTSQA